MTRPAIFLDRDGVLNPTVFNPATGKMESPLTVRDFRLCDGVIPALRQLQEAGYPLILVSNQPNYALGKCSYDNHRQRRQICPMQKCLHHENRGIVHRNSINGHLPKHKPWGQGQRYR